MTSPGLHVFDKRGHWLAVDPVSGALFRVGPAAASVLSDWGRVGPDESRQQLARLYGPERARSFVQEVQSLIETGGLFAPEVPKEITQERGQALRGLRAMCLNVAHACNMSCQYCFAACGNYGEETVLMPPAVAERAIDFLFARSSPHTRLEVDFFGGEPLLNLDAVRAAVDRARCLAEQHGRQVRFTLTTNALSLAGDVAHYVNETMDNVVLSIDGRPRVHDRWRRQMDGSGSHEQVLRHSQEFVAMRHGRDYWVRGTYTRDNLDFAEDVSYLVEQGFARISLEPVTATPGTGFFLEREHRAIAAEEYGRVVDILLREHDAGRDVRFFHFQLATGDRTCHERRAMGCGAGVDYVAITPGGDVYSCHQFVHVPEFRQGNVVQRTLSVPEWAPEADIYSKHGCPDCWARYMCGGGCHAAAYLAGDVGRPEPGACELHRARLEWAFYLATELKSRQQL